MCVPFYRGRCVCSCLGDPRPVAARGGSRASAARTVHLSGVAGSAAPGVSARAGSASRRRSVRSRPQGALNEASAKLELGKNADTVVKLEDFKAKVQQLEAAGHVSPGDAEALIAGADDAIACINSLSA